MKANNKYKSVLKISQNIHKTIDVWYLKNINMLVFKKVLNGKRTRDTWIIIVYYSTKKVVLKANASNTTRQASS